MRLPRSVGALALVVTVTGTAIGFVPLPPGAGDDGCAGHACQCVRRCPPKRQAAPRCHDKADRRPSCEMRGTCRHDEAATPLGGPIALEPETSETGGAGDVRPFRSVFAEPPLAGFFRIDGKPPRA